MLIWELSKRNLLINGLPETITFVTVLNRNRLIIHEQRCPHGTKTVIRILTDIVYCVDYIKDFPCLKNPTSYDYGLLEMSTFIAKKHKIKYD